MVPISLVRPFVSEQQFFETSGLEPYQNLAATSWIEWKLDALTAAWWCMWYEWLIKSMNDLLKSITINIFELFRSRCYIDWPQSLYEFFLIGLCFKERIRHILHEAMFYRTSILVILIILKEMVCGQSNQLHKSSIEIILYFHLE